MPLLCHEALSIHLLCFVSIVHMQGGPGADPGGVSRGSRPPPPLFFESTDFLCGRRRVDAHPHVHTAQ